MRQAWSQVDDRLQALSAQVADWPVTGPAEAVFTAPSASPPPRVLAAAQTLPDTSFVLWDAQAVRQQVNTVQALLRQGGLGLGIGLKACANTTILRMLADLGLYADAQSMGEVALGKQADFAVVTATGPAFGPTDMTRLLADGVRFDVQSLTQLDQLEHLGVQQPVGVRVRVSLPDRLRHPATKDVVSRFGLVIDQANLDRLRIGRLPINRLRVHTGEALSADVAPTLDYRLRLGLLLAEALDDVTEINLGGGILALSRQPAHLAAALDRLADTLAHGTAHLGRPLTCWLEPGSALLLDSAYLVTEVLDSDPTRHAVTVAASPWNLAPWAFPTVHVLDQEPWEFRGDVYGPALYENDRLRRTERHLPTGRMPRIGDRLVISSFGAYTMVHARTFGQLALPRQYLFDHQGIEEIR